MNKQPTPLDALHSFDHWIQVEFADQFKIIETALKEQQERIEELEETNHLMFLREHKNEKKLEALEIIKKKEVNVEDFIYSCKCSKQELKKVHNVDTNYDLACDCVGSDKEELTQEEFDLLKGIFGEMKTKKELKEYAKTKKTAKAST